MVINFIASVVGVSLGLAANSLLSGESFNWTALFWFIAGFALASML